MRVYVATSDGDSEFYTTLDNAKAAIDFWIPGNEGDYMRHLERAS